MKSFSLILCDVSCEIFFFLLITFVILVRLLCRFLFFISCVVIYLFKF